LECPEFDETCRRHSLLRIVVIGDCHGGRTVNLMSPLVASFFYGGTIFSWVAGKRSLPYMSNFIESFKPTMLHSSRCSSSSSCSNKVAIVFSYGEVDVRMHAAKWFKSTAQRCYGDCSYLDDDGDKAVEELEQQHVSFTLPSSPMALARGYVNKVLEYVNEIDDSCSNIAKIVPIILAIPPPSNARDNPQVQYEI
jgi:hypothetical protein